MFIYWRKILEYGSFRNIILRNQESIITPIIRKFTDPSSKLYQIVVNENAVITRHSNKIKLVKSGIEYYFVEVTSKNGVQYGIPAFGAEAFELYAQTVLLISVPGLTLPNQKSIPEIN
ncbi:MAG: hypothetical protein WB511_05920 [Nitrososphaeraceae archaeon]